MESLFRLLRRWFRVLQRSIYYVITFPRRIHLGDLIIHAFSFPQHEWAKQLRQNLADDPSELTWREKINPLFWVAWISQFSVRWLVTRPYMTLAPSFPAIAFVMILMGTVYAIWQRGPVETQTKYLDTLRTSLASGETAVASVAAQRLLALDPDNLEHQYQLALLDYELGKTESAQASICRLAIREQHGPAALWILKALIYTEVDQDSDAQSTDEEVFKKRTDWSDEEIRLCHECASIAMRKLPSERAVFAKKMYAGFLADINRHGDALRLYQSIAENDPSINLVAAKLASEINDYITAKQFASVAVRYLEPRLLEDPTNSPLRLKLAQALVLEERDDEAYRLLIEGMGVTYDPVLSAAAGETLIFKSERLRREVGESETLLLRAQLLVEALKLAPNNVIVTEAVVQLAIECGEAEDDEILRVRKALLRGVSPAAMHFVEGTVLLMAGESEAAQHHLELAAKDGANMAGLLNNLAVALTTADEKYLPQARRFSNEAVRQMQNHPHLRETRGQIHLRMGNYQDAIADLEKAVSNPQMRPLAYAGLAKAYEALGVEDLAQQHRSLAERYRSQLPRN